MKASIELALRTREVNQLFHRKINGDRLFIEAILHKFNIVINRCNQQNPQALTAHKQIEQKLQDLTRQFTAEITKFEMLLTKKKYFDNKTINFLSQFHLKITVTNPLALQLIELIETYDKLIAMLKFLGLAGCFKEDEIYFENIKRIQKSTNSVLSKILLISTDYKASSSQAHEIHIAI